MNAFFHSLSLSTLIMIINNDVMFVVPHPNGMWYEIFKRVYLLFLTRLCHKTSSKYMSAKKHEHIWAIWQSTKSAKHCLHRAGQIWLTIFHNFFFFRVFFLLFFSFARFHTHHPHVPHSQYERISTHFFAVKKERNWNAKEIHKWLVTFAHT